MGKSQNLFSTWKTGALMFLSCFLSLIGVLILSADTSPSLHPWINPGDTEHRHIRDIPCPRGYNRINEPKGSFAEWLRDLPLKPPGTKVFLYNKKPKLLQNLHYAVVDIDTGKQDLQQCADAIMRLMAEYRYSRGEFDQIWFYFADGFKAEYSKWRQGYRLAFQQDRCIWQLTGNPDTSYSSFRNYLDTVFMYANTTSLEMQSEYATDLNAMKPGDILLDVGERSTGRHAHTVIIVDTAVNKEGKKIFLIAQSYMPAQDIHILKSIDFMSPWYKVDFGDVLETPSWIFKKNHFARLKL